MDCNRAVDCFFLEKQIFEDDNGIADIHSIPDMFHKIKAISGDYKSVV